MHVLHLKPTISEGPCLQRCQTERRVTERVLLLSYGLERSNKQAQSKKYVNAAKRIVHKQQKSGDTVLKRRRAISTKYRILSVDVLLNE